LTRSCTTRRRSTASRPSRATRSHARKAAGKPGQWLKIILEEVYEAFEVEPTADTAADVYAELIQAGAMFIAAAEDLRKQFG
jgi:hypothetical protein